MINMDEIELLREEGCPENVIAHCIAVCKRAEEIARNFPEADKDLIRTGALLHDLGRSRTHGIKHAVVGANLAREHGYPEDVVRIIERHIGVGITEEEAKSLGLPVKSYVPETIEEKIVAHADNLLHGTERVDKEYVIKKWKKRMESPNHSIEKLIKLDYELIGQFEN
jgi:uncharacterized protein